MPSSWFPTLSTSARKDGALRAFTAPLRGARLCWAVISRIALRSIPPPHGRRLVRRTTARGYFHSLSPGERGCRERPSRSAGARLAALQRPRPPDPYQRYFEQPDVGGRADWDGEIGRAYESETKPEIFGLWTRGRFGNIRWPFLESSHLWLFSRDGRAAECGGLKNRYRAEALSGVRIPFSPLRAGKTGRFLPVLPALSGYGIHQNSTSWV